MKNLRYLMAAVRRTGLVLGVLCFGAFARAHFCGPPTITVGVGETVPWRIVADLFETETTYTPTLTGPSGVVRVFPQQQFLSKHGDFVFTGLALGTNVLQVHWFYPGTGAQNDCFVTITVVSNPPPLRYSTVPREGSLVTYDDQLPADSLRSMIDRYIPAESQKLLVLTECYAGNIAASPSFANAPNTCILAATVQNQTGKYGGYHDDAARALKPETGRTALNVHEQGVKGKKTSPPPPHGTTNRWAYVFEHSEFPIVGGTLPPAGFSLEPITASSLVQSRHIVIFMGDPMAKQVNIELHDGVTVPLPSGVETTIRDTDDRDAIIQNFSGQPNTTVVTVGGAPNPNDSTQGTNGWSKPGTARSLARAIEAVGNAMRNSENPAREQFILFVGDHGDVGFDAAPFRTNAAAHSSIFLPEALKIFGGEDALYELISADPNSSPVLHVQVEPAGQNLVAPRAFAPPPAFPPGSISVTLSAGAYNQFTLEGFSQVAWDWDADGQINPTNGEYVTLQFGISELDLLMRFLGQNVTVQFNNRSDQNLVVTGLRLNYGNWPRTASPIPPPRLTRLALTPSQVQLTMVALQFENYAVDYSTNLPNWLPLITNQPIAEISTLNLTRPPSAKSAVYRLRWIKSP